MHRFTLQPQANALIIPPKVIFSNSVVTRPLIIHCKHTGCNSDFLILIWFLQFSSFLAFLFEWKRCIRRTQSIICRMTWDREPKICTIFLFINSVCKSSMCKSMFLFKFHVLNRVRMFSGLLSSESIILGTSKESVTSSWTLEQDGCPK